jgi:hypothetical protein
VESLREFQDVADTTYRVQNALTHLATNWDLTSRLLLEARLRGRTGRPGVSNPI